MRKVGGRNPHTLPYVSQILSMGLYKRKRRQKLTVVVHQGDLIVTHKPRRAVNTLGLAVSDGKGGRVHTSYISQLAMILNMTKPF